MKKINHTNFQSDYKNYLYTGFAGILMRTNHKKLSYGVDKKMNKKILEIGGGANPHFKIVNLEGVEEYWISDNKILLDNLKLNKTNINNVPINYHNAEKDPFYNDFVSKNIKFNRIIASHVLEHIPNPEKTFLKWIDLLEPDGQLDIAIPCDPGILFRIGQLIGRKKAIKNYKLNFKEIELMMSREHINSCQNIQKIIKYYTSSKITYFPFKVPFINLNLFMFIKIKKDKDFLNYK